MKVYKNEKGRELVLQSYDRLLTRWGIEIKEEEIKTTYGTTHVIKAGNPANKPLIMFHGVGDNSAIMWIFNAKKLSEFFYLIAVDTIGGPGKSVPNENYDKNFSQIKWVDEIISALQVEKPSLIGVSNGAAIVQNYGARNIERIDRIVSMAGGLLYGKGSPISKMLKVFLPEALFPNDKNVRKLLEKLTGENSAVFIDDRELMEHWSYLLRYFNNMSMSYHKPVVLADEEVVNLKDRMMVLIGNKDPIAYSLESAGVLEEKGISYQILENTGHAINHERAEKVNSILIDYLK